MSDNIPFDIQMEIVKKVSSVKSLVQFRSVSKQWKSFIDSSDFIKSYGARHTEPHSHILSYRSDYAKPDEWHLSSSWWSQEELRYICLVDDDIETFKVQEQESAPFVVSPLLKQCSIGYFVGACHGLLCLCGRHDDNDILVIWNPSIGKSVGIALARFYIRKPAFFAFAVCPVTSDPTVVKFEFTYKMPWHVEVFTLSSGVWNVIPSGNLPPQTVSLKPSNHVVIDKFIYWCAHGESTLSNKVVSFDLITKEFKVVNLPDTLNKVYSFLSVSKLRGSLVVCHYMPMKASVWVMENDSSFRKLFTIQRIHKILGFKKNGETIFITRKAEERVTYVLDVYDPCFQQIKNLEICGSNSSFFMGSYKESLLLLDHLDSHIYYENN